MTERDPLDDFFEAARGQPVRASQDLMARVAADALHEVRRAPKPVQRRQGVFAVIGGWPAIGGLATATLAGIWIGVANPLGVDPLGLVGAGGFVTADLSTGYADLVWGVE